MVKKETVEELVELQRRIDRDRRQYELDAWMRLHLGIGQLKTLFFISNRGATTTGKLATALKVTPTNVTGIIDRLLEKNLITRTGDPDDRRVLLLRTTPQGDELVAELRQKRRERMSELFSRLSEEEAAVVAQGLKIMVKAIDTKPDEAVK
ncbi:MAG: MarR family transcriptional regulator [Dehalococcoidales bacterium]|jgi:DNA-binding MarR family transcriptional regulator